MKKDIQAIAADKGHKETAQHERTETGRLLVAAMTDKGLRLYFNPDEATFRRAGPHLEIEINGKTVTIPNFFVSRDETLPGFILMDGTEMDGAQFFGEHAPDLDVTTLPGEPPTGFTAYADDSGNLVDGVDRLGDLELSFVLDYGNDEEFFDAQTRPDAADGPDRDRTRPDSGGTPGSTGSGSATDGSANADNGSGNGGGGSGNTDNGSGSSDAGNAGNGGGSGSGSGDNGGPGGPGSGGEGGGNTGDGGGGDTDGGGDGGGTDPVDPIDPVEPPTPTIEFPFTERFVMYMEASLLTGARGFSMSGVTKTNRLDPDHPVELTCECGHGTARLTRDGTVSYTLDPAKEAELLEAGILVDYIRFTDVDGTTRYIQVVLTTENSFDTNDPRLDHTVTGGETHASHTAEDSYTIHAASPGDNDMYFRSVTDSSIFTGDGNDFLSFGVTTDDKLETAVQDTAIDTGDGNDTMRVDISAADAATGLSGSTVDATRTSAFSFTTQVSGQTAVGVANSRILGGTGDDHFVISATADSLSGAGSGQARGLAASTLDTGRGSDTVTIRATAENNTVRGMDASDVLHETDDAGALFLDVTATGRRTHALYESSVRAGAGNDALHFSASSEADWAVALENSTVDTGAGDDTVRIHASSTEEGFAYGMESSALLHAAGDAGSLTAHINAEGNFAVGGRGSRIRGGDGDDHISVTVTGRYSASGLEQDNTVLTGAGNDTVSFLVRGDAYAVGITYSDILHDKDATGSLTLSVDVAGDNAEGFSGGTVRGGAGNDSVHFLVAGLEDAIGLMSDAVVDTGRGNDRVVVDVSSQTTEAIGMHKATIRHDADDAGTLEATVSASGIIAIAMEESLIQGGAGNDTLVVSVTAEDEATALQTSTLAAGGGNDDIAVTAVSQTAHAAGLLNSNVTRDVGAPGNLRLQAVASGLSATAAENSTVRAGNGDDRLEFHAAAGDGWAWALSNNTAILTGAGNDTVVLDATGQGFVYAFENASILHDADSGSLTLEASSQGYFAVGGRDSRVQGGAGDDSISIAVTGEYSASGLEQGNTILTGAGNDTVTFLVRGEVYAAGITISDILHDKDAAGSLTLSVDAEGGTAEGLNEGTVRGGAGNDAVRFRIVGDEEATGLIGGATIDTGRGNDTVVVDVTSHTEEALGMQKAFILHDNDVAGSLTVDLSASGAEAMAMDESAVRSGAGSDSIAVRATAASGEAVGMKESDIAAGSGNDTVSVTASALGGKATALLDSSASHNGTAADALRLDVTASGLTAYGISGGTVQAGAGNDHLSFSATATGSEALAVHDNSAIHTGTGNDTVVVESYSEQGTALGIVYSEVDHDADDTGALLLSVTARGLAAYAVNSSAVRSGAGNDALSFTAEGLQGAAFGIVGTGGIATGAGNDTVTIAVTSQNATAYGLGGTTIAHDADDTGSMQLTLTASGVSAWGASGGTVQGGAGSDTLDITATALTGTAIAAQGTLLDLGRGNDTVRLTARSSADTVTALDSGTVSHDENDAGTLHLVARAEGGASTTGMQHAMVQSGAGNDTLSFTASESAVLSRGVYSGTIKTGAGEDQVMVSASGAGAATALESTVILHDPDSGSLTLSAKAEADGLATAMLGGQVQGGAGAETLTFSAAGGTGAKGLEGGSLSLGGSATAVIVDAVGAGGSGLALEGAQILHAGGVQGGLGVRARAEGITAEAMRSGSIKTGDGDDTLAFFALGTDGGAKGLSHGALVETGTGNGDVTVSVTGGKDVVLGMEQATLLLGGAAGTRTTVSITAGGTGDLGGLDAGSAIRGTSLGDMNISVTATGTGNATAFGLRTSEIELAGSETSRNTVTIFAENGGEVHGLRESGISSSNAGSDTVTVQALSRNTDAYAARDSHISLAGQEGNNVSLTAGGTTGFGMYNGSLTSTGGGKDTLSVTTTGDTDAYALYKTAVTTGSGNDLVNILAASGSGWAVGLSSASGIHTGDGDDTVTVNASSSLGTATGIDDSEILAGAAGHLSLEIQAAGNAAATGMNGGQIQSGTGNDSMNIQVTAESGIATGLQAGARLNTGSGNDTVTISARGGDLAYGMRDAHVAHDQDSGSLFLSVEAGAQVAYAVSGGSIRATENNDNLRFTVTAADGAYGLVNGADLDLGRGDDSLTLEITSLNGPAVGLDTVDILRDAADAGTLHLNVEATGAAATGMRQGFVQTGTGNDSLRFTATATSEDGTAQAVLGTTIATGSGDDTLSAAATGNNVAIALDNATVEHGGSGRLTLDAAATGLEAWGLKGGSVLGSVSGNDSLTLTVRGSELAFAMQEASVTLGTGLTTIEAVAESSKGAAYALQETTVHGSGTLALTATATGQADNGTAAAIAMEGGKITGGAGNDTLNFSASTSGNAHAYGLLMATIDTGAGNDWIIVDATSAGLGDAFGSILANITMQGGADETTHLSMRAQGFSAQAMNSGTVTTASGNNILSFTAIGNTGAADGISDGTLLLGSGQDAVIIQAEALTSVATALAGTDITSQGQAGGTASVRLEARGGQAVAMDNSQIQAGTEDNDFSFHAVSETGQAYGMDNSSLHAGAGTDAILIEATGARGAWGLFDNSAIDAGSGASEVEIKVVSSSGSASGVSESEIFKDNDDAAAFFLLVSASGTAAVGAWNSRISGGAGPDTFTITAEATDASLSAHGLHSTQLFTGAGNDSVTVTARAAGAAVAMNESSVLRETGEAGDLRLAVVAGGASAMAMYGGGIVAGAGNDSLVFTSVASTGDAAGLAAGASVDTGGGQDTIEVSATGLAGAATALDAASITHGGAAGLTLTALAQGRFARAANGGSIAGGDGGDVLTFTAQGATGAYGVAGTAIATGAGADSIRITATSTEGAAHGLDGATVSSLDGLDLAVTAQGAGGAGSAGAIAMHGGSITGGTGRDYLYFVSGAAGQADAYGLKDALIDTGTGEDWVVVETTAENGTAYGMVDSQVTLGAQENVFSNLWISAQGASARAMSGGRATVGAGENIMSISAFATAGTAYGLSNGAALVLGPGGHDVVNVNVESETDTAMALADASIVSQGGNGHTASFHLEARGRTATVLHNTSIQSGDEANQYFFNVHGDTGAAYGMNASSISSGGGHDSLSLHAYAGGNAYGLYGNSWINTGTGRGDIEIVAESTAGRGYGLYESAITRDQSDTGAMYIDIAAKGTAGLAMYYGTIQTGAGDDSIVLTGETISTSNSAYSMRNSTLNTGTGNDTVVMNALGNNYLAYGMRDSTLQSLGGLTLSMTVAGSQAEAVYSSDILLGAGDDSLVIVAASADRVAWGLTESTMFKDAASTGSLSFSLDVSTQEVQAIGMRNSSINSGAGNDVIDIRVAGAETSSANTYAIQGSSIDTGNGNDSVSIWAGLVDNWTGSGTYMPYAVHNSTISLGEGNDTLRITSEYTALSSAAISMGDGNDETYITGALRGTNTIDMGTGNDLLVLANAAFASDGSHTFDGGKGVDVLRLDHTWLNTTASSMSVKSFEVIDLTPDAGTTGVTFSMSSLQALLGTLDAVTLDNSTQLTSLFIRGTDMDQLLFTDATYQLGSGNAAHNGVHYNELLVTNGYDEVSIYLQSGMIA